MTTLELKPCPFCGSNQISVIGVDKYWVQCESCGCEGPTPERLWPTKASAMNAWDERAGDAD